MLHIIAHERPWNFFNKIYIEYATSDARQSSMHKVIKRNVSIVNVKLSRNRG